MKTLKTLVLPIVCIVLCVAAIVMATVFTTPMVICLSLPLLLFTSLSIYHLSTNHLIAVEIVHSFTPNFSPKYLLLAQQYHFSAHKLLIKQYKSFWLALKSLSSSTTIGINPYPFSNTSIFIIGKEIKLK